MAKITNIRLGDGFHRLSVSRDKEGKEKFTVNRLFEATDLSESSTIVHFSNTDQVEQMINLLYELLNFDKELEKHQAAKIIIDSDGGNKKVL